MFQMNSEAIFLEQGFDDADFLTASEKDLREMNDREEYFLNKEKEDVEQEALRLKHLSDANSDLLACAIPSSRYIPVPAYPQEREFLPGLRKGRLGVISASGSTGKSFFCLQLALASAAGGLPIFGALLPLLQERIRVAYLIGEEDTQDIDRRIRSIVAYYHKMLGDGLTVWKPMLEHLRLIPMQAHPPCVYDPKGPVNGVGRIEKLCDDFHPELLIIDPLCHFHRADENDNGQMTHVMQLFTQIAAVKDCALLITHHMNKGSILSGQGSLQQATRGASAIVDNARWVMSMTKPIKGGEKDLKTEDGRKIQVAFPKLNNCAPIKPFTLYRGPGGVLDIHNMWGGDRLEDCR